MVKNFETLVALCEEELRHREYIGSYYARLISYWDELRSWMDRQGITEFDEDVGNRYLDEIFGTHLLPEKSKVRVRKRFRAVRMLISYQKSGEFEFRIPSVEYRFDGSIGVLASEYLDFCHAELANAQKTIDNKRLYLHDFSRYMDDREMSFSDLSVDEMEEFFRFKEYSLSSRHNGSRVIRHFLQHVYDTGKSTRDCYVFVLKDNYRKQCKLPTTYEEQEIRDMIGSVERASAIGKRDYLVLILATEYGWRAKDKRTCGQRLHVEIDKIWRMPNLIHSIITVGWNYNSTHYSMTEIKNGIQLANDGM